MHDIKLVRAFDLANGTEAAKGGATVLVDALWPRGIKKQNLPLDVSRAHPLLAKCAALSKERRRCRRCCRRRRHRRLPRCCFPRSFSPRTLQFSFVVQDWCKTVAPSKALREWFGHDPAKWAEFQRRYTAELEGNEAAWRPLLTASQRGPLTMVYSARDEQHNNAVVLLSYLQRKLEAAGTGRSGGAAGAVSRSTKKRDSAVVAADEGGVKKGRSAKRARRTEE